MDERELIEHAYRAREYAYTPYSDFRVGAALLTKSGKLYYGCNIESASYTPTNCAERTAFFKAVSEGEREFEGIAIVGGKGTGRSGNVCAPCGVCRQVMQEFCRPDEFYIVLEDGKAVAVGTHEELMQNCSDYQEIYYSQFPEEAVLHA